MMVTSLESLFLSTETILTHHLDHEPPVQRITYRRSDIPLSPYLFYWVELPEPYSELEGHWGDCSLIILGVLIY